MDEGSCKKDFRVVSLTPDVCKSPITPVPYPIVALLADSVDTAERVHFHAKRSSDTFTLNSRITRLSGDEAGTGGGVVSGVNQGWCRPINGSTTVFAQGGGVLQSERSYFFMNCAGPEGPGNTIGQLLYDPPQATAKVGPGGRVGLCNPSCFPENTAEAGFLDALSGGAGGGIGDIMDWAKQGYELSQIDWSNPAGVLGAIGDMAGLAGIGGIANATQIARMGYNLASMDWSNPAGVLGAVGGVAGLAGLSDVARFTRMGQQAYQLATSDWRNPSALMQGIGMGAGLMGHQGIANAAKAGQQAYAIATTDWRNPGAIVGSAMNLAGMIGFKDELLPNPNGPTCAPDAARGLPPGLMSTPAFVPIGDSSPGRLPWLSTHPGSGVDQHADPVLGEIAKTRWQPMQVLSALNLEPVGIDNDGRLPGPLNPQILAETTEERSRLINQRLMQPYTSAGKVLQPEDFPLLALDGGGNPAVSNGFAFTPETPTERRYLTNSVSAETRQPGSDVFRIQAAPTAARASPSDLGKSEHLLAPSRRDCIVQERSDCDFKITPNPQADGSTPLYELELFSEVNEHASIINKAARETKVDADLVRAVMYMETTHGYYDAPLALVGLNDSILPMNINTDYWGNTFGTREDLLQAEHNVKAGAELLSRIQQQLPANATQAQIATLYNNINATTVSDYGARVEQIYADKPWQDKH